jgi:hypothetical protein
MKSRVFYGRNPTYWCQRLNMATASYKNGKSERLTTHTASLPTLNGTISPSKKAATLPWSSAISHLTSAKSPPSKSARRTIAARTDEVEIEIEIDADWINSALSSGVRADVLAQSLT